MKTFEFRMTAEDFCKWLDEMQRRGIAATDYECGLAIGRSKFTVIRCKRDGADYLTALACGAALAKVVPFGEAAKIKVGIRDMEAAAA